MSNEKTNEEMDKIIEQKLRASMNISDEELLENRKDMELREQEIRKTPDGLSFYEVDEHIYDDNDGIRIEFLIQAIKDNLLTHIKWVD